MERNKKKSLEQRTDSVYDPTKFLTGEQYYEKIVKENPEILRDYYGLDIWIYPKTGDYAIGPGLAGAKKLMEKVGPKNAKFFYSRKIGRLERIPFF